MNTAIIIAIISVVGTAINSAFLLMGKIKQSECGVVSCSQGNNDIQLALDSEGRLENIIIPQNSDDG